MTALAAEIRERIRREGPLSVATYMELCLSHPTLGYYRRGRPIGAAGDFITAPEVSQMFGELIGLWCAAVWQTMGRPRRVGVVELGPGRGTLLADALRAAGTVPHFRDAIEVHLVESSETLRAEQAARLGDVQADLARAFRDRTARPGARHCERILRCLADPSVRADRRNLAGAGRHARAVIRGAPLRRRRRTVS